MTTFTFVSATSPTPTAAFTSSTNVTASVTDQQTSPAVTSSIALETYTYSNPTSQSISMGTVTGTSGSILTSKTIVTATASPLCAEYPSDNEIWSWVKSIDYYAICSVG